MEFIRIGTRIPIFMPQRITDSLCQIFQEFAPIWMSLHVNHPKECTIEFKEACAKLLQSNTVLGNQSVLLKGINDNSATLTSLSHRLLQIGVKPYYLHLCDLIAGSSHFRCDVKKALDIISEMRGFTTGYAIPQAVIDTPSGGKVPINPNYVQSYEEDLIHLRNYQRKKYTYPRYGKKPR